MIKKTKYLNYRHKKEEFQVSSIEQIYNKITDENFPKQGTTCPYRYKKHTEYTVDQARKETPHDIFRTL